MRLVFLGSPPFATPVLERLLGSSHTVLALVTRPAKPRGRGLKVESSPLVELARAKGIPVLQPASAKDPAFVATLRGLAPDALLVASYGEILGRDLLELAPLGALNVHASLLPRHRGASPIQAAILAGDAETGVSIQRMVLALDEGDVLIEKRMPIGPRETAGKLLERLAILAGEATLAALELLESGRAVFSPQDPARATYARRIRKEGGRIDWTKSAVEIETHIRAMTPWPGARTGMPDGRDLVLLESCAVREAPSRLYDWIGPQALGLPVRSLEFRGPDRAPPGTIIVVDDRPFVATGENLLELQVLKPAGKAAMDAKAWLRGAHLEPGARFAS